MHVIFALMPELNNSKMCSLSTGKCLIELINVKQMEEKLRVYLPESDF